MEVLKMQTNYQVNTQIIYLDDIEEYLKLIVEIVLKPSRYILKKIKSLNTSDIKEFNKERYQTNYNTLINNYDELEIKFNNDKIYLYHEMDSLANSLKDNDLFYDEYFDFCEIQDIIKDTFDRNFSLIKDADFDFILDLVINFSKLINHKIDLVETNTFNEEKFESEYMDYLTNFNKSKTYYYENICDESIDDDVFKEFTNIIMG